MQLPEEKNGFIPTLNNRGFMTSFLDPFSKEIIEFSKAAPGPFLDIGAAYKIFFKQKTGSKFYKRPSSFMAQKYRLSHRDLKVFYKKHTVQLSNKLDLIN